MTGQESPLKIPNREPQTIVFPEITTTENFFKKLVAFAHLVRQGYWPTSGTEINDNDFYDRHIRLEHERNLSPTQKS